MTAVRKRGAGRSNRGRSDAWLLLIGVFKLLKGVGLVIAGVGLLRLLHRDIAQTVNHWIQILGVDPDNRHIQALLLRIFNVTPKQLRALSIGTFIYAAIFTTEGVGLLSRKHWAEYMTLISTALFLPLEIYELMRHFTWLKVAVTVANALIVVYLAARVKRR